MNGQSKKKRRFTAFTHNTGPQRIVPFANTLMEQFSSSTLSSGGKKTEGIQRQAKKLEEAQPPAPQQNQI